MTKTIQAALSPLLITGSFCCLGFFEYPLGRVRLYPSCLYFLCTWSIYAYLFYYLLFITNIPLILISWTNIITMIVSIVSILISLFRYQGLKTCLRKLAIVDDSLEMLGTPKEYRQLYSWMIRMVIGWIITACLADIMDFFSWSYSKDQGLEVNLLDIVVTFMANHFLHINNVNALIWGTILGYTGSRFQRINERIRDMLEDTREGNALVSVGQRRKETTESKWRMWIIMHIHLQLSCISRELNKVFSMQMTLEMACLFTFLVELFLDIYELYADDSKNMFYQIMESSIIYIWAVLFIMKLLALNYICQIVCDKANRTIAILCELSNGGSDDDMREQILQFILQIKQRQVKFSGMGLFNFGYSFIYKFFTSIMTVVVIIVQMNTSHRDKPR